MKSKVYNLLAAAIIFGYAVFESVHDLRGATWPGFTQLADIVAAVYVPIWVIVAAGLALDTPWGAAFSLPAALTQFLHGLMINAGGSKMGLLPIACGTAASLLLWRGQPWRVTEAEATPPSTEEEEPRRAA